MDGPTPLRNMGIKNISFFTLWIILGKFCATFASEPDTGTDAEFGEFADWGGGGRFSRFSCEIFKNKKKKASVRVGLQVCITLETVCVQVRVCAGQPALSGGEQN